MPLVWVWMLVKRKWTAKFTLLSEESVPCWYLSQVESLSAALSCPGFLLNEDIYPAKGKELFWEKTQVYSGPKGVHQLQMSPLVTDITLLRS